jgi:hypothetical protein
MYLCRPASFAQGDALLGAGATCASQLLRQVRVGLLLGSRPAPVAPLSRSVSAAAGACRVAVAGVGRRQLAARSDSTEASVAEAIREFAAWEATLSAACAVSLCLATPADVLWYFLAKLWLGHHGRECLVGVLRPGQPGCPCVGSGGGRSNRDPVHGAGSHTSRGAVSSLPCDWGTADGVLRPTLVCCPTVPV